jgi:ribonuclease VapC
MIVLDSSILVGIIKGEQNCVALIDMLDAEQCTIGAPTLLETRLWCALNSEARASKWLEALVDSDKASIIAFSREMADAASDAFLRYGRASGHRAKLNFGDCMAYGVSSVLRAPLLFKGADFGLTDVMAHPSSVRA